jgi:hypothetical protein
VRAPAALNIALTPASAQWSLSPDPRQWGSSLALELAEDDDALHRPEKDMALLDRGGGMFTARGLLNLGCLGILALGLLALLCVSASVVGWGGR